MTTLNTNQAIAQSEVTELLSLLEKSYKEVIAEPLDFYLIYFKSKDDIFSTKYYENLTLDLCYGEGGYCEEKGYFQRYKLYRNS